MFEEDFGDYAKYKKYLQELHKAELIVIGPKTITFLNVWGKYIDRTQLEKVSPDEYVAGFNFSSIQQFVADLESNELLHETCAIKYRIKTEQVVKMLPLFISEQMAFDKKYSGWSDCAKHFTYWLGKNLNAVEVKKGGSSKNKILGL